MDKDTILSNHIEFKKTSVSSKYKLQDIKRYVGMFLKSNRKPLSDFGEEDITKFINKLNYSIGTINDIKIYLKVFIKWYFADWSSRFRNLDRICRQQKPPKTYQPEDMLSVDDMERLAKGEKDLMWKVYWLLLFYGGFRPSECARLKWSDVYFEPKGVIIKLHTTKTNKDFYKSLPQNVEQLLKDWKHYNTTELLFPSPIKQGDCVKSRSVCHRLKRLSKKVLGRVVVPYQIRHSIGTILYNDTHKKDDHTANQMGHSKSMKHIYLNLDGEKIKANARNLWLDVELSPKDRSKLELEIEEQKNEIKKLQKEMKELSLMVVKNLKIRLKNVKI